MIKFTQSTLAKPVFLAFVSIPISGLELTSICMYLLSYNYLYFSCFYSSHFVQRKLSQKTLSISWKQSLHMSWVDG